MPQAVGSEELDGLGALVVVCLPIVVALVAALDELWLGSG